MMTQQPAVEELAARIAAYLENERGAVEESALVGRFRGPGRVRTLALRWLAERGRVRRVRNSRGTTVVALTTTPEPVVRATAHRYETRRDALAAERRKALKPTADEYGTDTGSYRFYAELLAEGGISANELPFKLPSRRDGCPEVRGPRRWEGGATEFATPRTATADSIPRAARRRAEEQLESGEAAWSTARAQYLSKLPTLAHKILHLLRRDGARAEASFVALAEAEECPVPEEAVREAARELGEAGKIRRVRSRKTGRELLAPQRRMTDRELDTLLLGVIADPRNRIPVPEGSRLARRVDGFRKAGAERRAEREAGAEAGELQPVGT